MRKRPLHWPFRRARRIFSPKLPEALGRNCSTGAVAMARHFPKARKAFFDDDVLSVQEIANGNIEASSSTLLRFPPARASSRIHSRNAATAGRSADSSG